MTEKEKYEYWFCEIGPVKRSEMQFGADGPLRQKVKNTFEAMFNRDASTCASGWGLTYDIKLILSRIRLLNITDPSGIKLKKIKEILDAEFLEFPDLEK
jgi:hypothetical protein